MIADFERRLRRKIRAHVRRLGFAVDRHWKLEAGDDSKTAIRILHARQRRDRLESATKFLDQRLERALPSFASGCEVEPQKIQPRLEIVQSGTDACDLFRIASLTWSVPVSQGYGRRIRFLVWDESNHKVIGIAALGDPVFNLGVRDQFIGWDAEARSHRLVNLMDAYVLGAVPPYSQILCGEIIASLLRTTDIRDAFSSRYGNSRGVISGEKKCANLVMITTTSSLGRSSVYNRVSLAGMRYLEPIGFTGGYGHFHVDGDLFGDIADSGAGRARFRNHSGRHSEMKPGTIPG
ncbi:MAG TPA: Druantia anti-phage system protein DruA [Terriglobia bacterium]|nr:Druantia anti-phage system protein DruA [Terriglobia bacterium]